MYSYLIGTVVEMNIDHIVVENSGIGYLIYVNNPYEYTRGKEIKIFLYQQVKEDALLLYGFKTSEEKEMFLKLILVKGIGCKTAIHGFRNLILHHSCLCTLSSGIFENMHLIEMDPFQILFCESKFFLRFPRKAHDYIGCNGRMVKDLS